MADSAAEVRILQRKINLLLEENRRLSSLAAASQRRCSILELDKRILIHKILLKGGYQDFIMPQDGFSTALKRNSVDLNSTCSATCRDGVRCKSKAIHGTQFCWHHSPLDPNANIKICIYRNKKKQDKKCNLPISKLCLDDGILLCNYHRGKLRSGRGGDSVFTKYKSGGEMDRRNRKKSEAEAMDAEDAEDDDANASYDVLSNEVFGTGSDEEEPDIEDDEDEEAEQDDSDGEDEDDDNGSDVDMD